MNNKEINIKSSTIEKGLELAKTFVEKLISPTAEEVGLLVSDNIRYFRFKNQIKILLKAKKYVEAKGISIKSIPPKILVPLIENASLEEDEELQDKWAKMIVNLSDSETNLQNQIFPYILSQLSLNEFKSLEELYESERVFLRKKTSISEREPSDFYSDEEMGVIKEIEEVEQNGFIVFSNLSYELSNLERLGLLKKTLPEVIVEPPLMMYGMFGDRYKTKYGTVGSTYRITELGFSFMNICELELDKTI